MKKEATRPRGRPRTFDQDDVLDRAMMTFWAKTYTGASLDDLTADMGINRPSLYAAFGDKHALFMATIDHYAATIGARPIAALQDEPDLRKSVRAFLDAVVDNTSGAGHPRGCLIGCVVADCAENDPEVRTKLAAVMAATDTALAARYRQAQQDGQLANEADIDALAMLTSSVMHGIAVRARAGGTRAQLKQLARAAENFLLASAAD